MLRAHVELIADEQAATDAVFALHTLNIDKPGDGPLSEASYRRPAPAVGQQRRGLEAVKLPQHGCGDEECEAGGAAFKGRDERLMDGLQKREMRDEDVGVQAELDDRNV